jgi:hypothetical protein
MVDLGLSLGAAAVKVACKIWLKDHAIAADAGVEVADILKAKIADDRARRKVQRQFDQLEEAVADRIMSVLGHEFRGVDEGERAATVSLVHGTLHDASLTDADLFAADLDPIYLERHLRAGSRNPTRDLSEAGTALYYRLLSECCTDIVELTTALPEFGPAAFTEILRRETKLIEMVRELLDRVPAREITNLGASADEEFAAAYRAQIVNRLDRLKLFGVTQTTQRYPLSVAYISLNVGVRNIADIIGIHSATVIDSNFSPERLRLMFGGGGPTRVENVLSLSSRLLIRGEAGSGKTTLLQWLAVRSARYDFDDLLARWNASVPFFIQLRNYINRDLPEPADFVRQIGRHLAETMPQGWVTDLMSRGLAVLLVDGVDELPASKRQAARLWLSSLIEEFPHAKYVVTSRPAAVSEEWLKSEDFLTASLEPMSPADITNFVHKWHEAVSSEIVDAAEKNKLEYCEQKMQEALVRERRLRQLAINPLMCALLCALHRDRQGHLPHDRIEIYDAALEMLLERRDSERGVTDEIPGLTRRRKMIVLQALAYWLMRNGWSNGSCEGAKAQIQNCLSLMPDIAADASGVLRSLLERSGVVREPAVGRIDFIHRTFQEYLAARAILDAGDTGVLLRNADDDQWQEVFVLAVGYSGSSVRKELLKDLLKLAADTSHIKRARLHLVALACLETAPQVTAAERKQIEKAAHRLLPPTTMMQADTLAKAGEFALDLLMDQPINSAIQAAATIRTASLIGGDDALQLIRECAKRRSKTIDEELIRAWTRFDAITFARNILSKSHFKRSLSVSYPAMLPALRYVQPKYLNISFSPIGNGDITSLSSLNQLIYLYIRDPLLTDLRPLQNCVKLEKLTLRDTPGFDLGGLQGCQALRDLDFHYPDAAKPGDLAALGQLTHLQTTGLARFEPIQRVISPECKLRRFGLWNAAAVKSLKQMASDPRLSKLEFLLLGECGELRGISEIETWAETLSGVYLRASRLADYQILGNLPNLEFMNLSAVPLSDLSFIRGLQKMRVLHVGHAGFPVADLEPLLELPHLNRLYIRYAESVDLTPLRGKEGLEVHVSKDVLIKGEKPLGSKSKVLQDLQW